ncbi:MAG: imidazolonepropionase [Myxococcota bacterium]
MSISFIDAKIINQGRALQLELDIIGQRKIGVGELAEYSEQPKKIQEVEISGDGHLLLVQLNNRKQVSVPVSSFLPPVEPELFIDNIGQLILPDENGRLEIVENAAVVVGQGKIMAKGSRTKVMPWLQSNSPLKIIDAANSVVSPGLVDCHTHPVFARNRADEFAQRLAGATYDEILDNGGGILNSARLTRETSLLDLEKAAYGRIARSLSYGVTSLEAKSGYALNLKGEIKSLQVLENLSQTLPVDISPSLLAAHALPEEFQSNREGYIDLIVDKILPEVKLKDLAKSCDAFCEKSAFSLEETARVMRKAKALGLDLRIHAGQFNSLGAVKLGAELGALSVDHLEEVSPEELSALEQSQTVAVFLPGAALTLGMRPPSPERFLERGIPVALGTDMNPGTSMTENLPLMASFGCMQMKMTVDEVWRALTVNAAKAAGWNRRAALRQGEIADLVIWDFKDYRSLPYHYGINSVTTVIKRGKQVISSATDL